MVMKKMQALKSQNKSIEEIYKYTNDIIFEEDEEESGIDDEKNEDEDSDFYQNSPKQGKKKPLNSRAQYSSLDGRRTNHESVSVLDSYSHHNNPSRKLEPQIRASSSMSNSA